MGFKAAVAYSVAFLLIALLALYWILPFEIKFFGAGGSGNYNFSLGNQSNESMQFYPNMRYPTGNISYDISPDCSLQKADEVNTAVGILENDTTLSFYHLQGNGEISITCSDKNIVKGRLFIAGEGGPTNITQSGSFNVITKGTILIIRDSNCQEPNIAIHELLHALGFNHSMNPNNVMYPVTSCDQTIGQDTIDMIDQLYSVPSLPDLLFENASASMNGRYVDVNFTVRNSGLTDAPASIVQIYADGNKIQDINLDPMAIGDGRIVTMTNIFTLQAGIKQIRFFIKTDFPELEKENNEAILNYTS